VLVAFASDLLLYLHWRFGMSGKNVHIVCGNCNFETEVFVQDGDDHYVCPNCGASVGIPAELQVFGPKAALSLLAVLAVIGFFVFQECQSSASADKAAAGFPSVRSGMGLDQVRDIMGKPEQTQHAEIDVGFGTQVSDCWYWAGVRYQICFMNGRVESKAKN